jgi:acyl-CoA dehydrogenase
MDFGYSQKVLDLQAKLRSFMAGLVLPNNERWHREVEAGSYPLELVDELKVQAKASRLWNLFMPGLRDDEPGTRLTNLEYAPLAEIMGRVPWSAEVFNCSAPDTGNMEILHMFASPQQSEH